MRIALKPLNPTVGAIAANADLVIDAIGEARRAGADLVVLPELALCGYPPRDLLLKEGFLAAIRTEAERVARAAVGLTAIVGAPWRIDWSDPAAGIANSLLVMRDGAIAERYDKRLLPTYDVFDEDRYFVTGDQAVVIEVRGKRVGLSVCEDLWRGEDVGVSPRYRRRDDPVRALVEAGAEIIVNASASPFSLRKKQMQHDLVRRHAASTGLVFAAVNQLGGNDELVFDGDASIFAPTGAGGARLIASLPGFREDMLHFDLSNVAAAASVEDPIAETSDEHRLWSALVLAVRDYCRKTGFAGALLGLSGGIDSAVTACVAAAALGPEQVLAVSMPSRYSSTGSIVDARALADRLGIEMLSAPIEGPHASMERLLDPLFADLGGDQSGVTEENVQSRLRGVIMMAFSNKTGRLLLTTGNKSEFAVGYCTLYGDMNGGYAVLSDVTKTNVYRLARWVNRHHASAGFREAPIPEASIDKPPSAELRPDQTDQDSLPPYEALDEIIERYVERRQSARRIAEETGL
ncbi:MAG: NAD+ synthase, partial [Planctomycetota bacterium]|nr:NAD+ synthase [Planctomycetota bacterium]